MPAPITTARAVAGRELADPDCAAMGHLGVGADGRKPDISHPDALVTGVAQLVVRDSRRRPAGAAARTSSTGSASTTGSGVVMSRPCGAVGASALITATITAFYDIQRARGDDFFVYPDYFLFHVGRRLGDHARLDVWPRHKEVVVGEEPAADPRGDQRPRRSRGSWWRTASRRRRGRGPTRWWRAPGRGSRRAWRTRRRGGWPTPTCGSRQPGDRGLRGGDPGSGERGIERLRAEADPASAARSHRSRPRSARSSATPQANPRRAERALRDGVPVETYRRIGLDEALGLLGSPTPAAAG